MSWFDRFRQPFGKKTPDQETPAPGAQESAAAQAEPAPPPPVQFGPPPLPEPPLEVVTPAPVPEPEAAVLPPPAPAADAPHVPPAPVVEEVEAPPALPEPVEEPIARPAPPEPIEEPVAPPALPEPVAEAPTAPIVPEAAGVAEPPNVGEQGKRGFWAKAWDVLNAPIPGTPSFGMDRELIGQIAERLSTTRKVLVDRVRSLVKGRTKIDEDLLEGLEELLLESDMGLAVADGALEYIRAEAKAGRLSPDGVTEALATYLKSKLGPASPLSLEKGTLHIVLLVGVNGTGKTTTLGKLAHRCVLQGYKVVVAAADTFRAAAIDQLEVWAERAGVPVVRHAEGGDAAAVVFDAIASAKSRGADVVLVDTAGRLHNKANLMAELAKIRRIVDREAPDSPKEVLLVLDATTGQNGLRQAEVFGEAVKLTGVVLSKLDGTAKGGVIFAIKDILGLPVRLVGLGETIEDLRDFDPEVFVDALFAEKVEAATAT